MNDNSDFTDEHLAEMLRKSVGDVEEILHALVGRGCEVQLITERVRKGGVNSLNFDNSLTASRLLFGPDYIIGVYISKYSQL